MSHNEQREFCASVKLMFPAMFTGQTVLDVGSYDVNGNNRYLFTESEYFGCDVHRGPNVNHVGPCWTIDKQFSVVISTEMLEHDQTWQQSLHGMFWRLLPKGLLLITCAGPGRGPHGGPTKAWGSFHYENVAPIDILANLPLHGFEKYAVSYRGDCHDSYFWGVKR